MRLKAERKAVCHQPMQLIAKVAVLIDISCGVQIAGIVIGLIIQKQTVRKTVFMIGVPRAQEGAPGALIKVQALFPRALANDIHSAVFCRTGLIAQAGFQQADIIAIIEVKLYASALGPKAYTTAQQ